MPDPLVTLTTDFGDASPYVAALKGSLLSINPAVRILDLTHRIPPQDLRHVHFFLAAALPYFPEGTLHVIVVDPGVGTDRALLYVETSGQRLLCPDNGCWTALEHAGARVIRLTERRYWRKEISATFHGRDILAPAAGHLSLGLDPLQLGPTTDRWVRLAPPTAHESARSIAGETVFVDEFGNLLTNIRAVGLRPPDVLTIGRRRWTRRFRWVRTYAEAKPGTLVALVSSEGRLEIAVVEGNAADRLNAAVGTPVCVEWKSSPPQSPMFRG